MAVEKKNIFLKDTNTTMPYVSRSMMGSKNFPQRENGRSHALFIGRKLQQCYERSSTQKQAAAIRYKEGVYIEFSSSAEYDLAVKSLENRTQGIRLLNVKTDEEEKIVKATVYVPSGKEQYFIGKIEAYLTEVTGKGVPKNNDLISSIEDVRLALLESFWIGKIDNIPDVIEEWCEVWIRYDLGYMDQAIDALSDCCSRLNIHIDNKKLEFPERLVFLIKVNKEQLTNLISCCDYITEFRKASEPTSFFDDL